MTQLMWLAVMGSDNNCSHKGVRVPALISQRVIQPSESLHANAQQRNLPSSVHQRPTLLSTTTKSHQKRLTESAKNGSRYKNRLPLPMQYHRRLRTLSESPRTFHYFLNKCARSITHHTTDVAAMIITQSIKANGVTENISPPKVTMNHCPTAITAAIATNEPAPLKCNAD